MQSQVFLDIDSSDDGVRSNAASTIYASFEDPQFVFFLLEQLKSTDQAVHPKLAMLIQIVLVQQLRTKLTDDSVFWAFEQQSQIFAAIMSLMLSCPPASRSNFVECMRIIVTNAFPASTQLVSGLLPAIQSSDSVDDLDSLIQIVKFYAKKCALSNLAETDNSDDRQSIEELSAALLACFGRICQILTSSPVSSAQSVSLLCSIARSIGYISKKTNSHLKSDFFDPILSLFLSVLPSSSSMSEMPRLKRSICKLFIQLCSSFFPPPDPEAAIRSEYSGHFKDVIAPALLESIEAAIQTDASPSVKPLLLYLIFQFIFYDVCTSSILTEAFIKSLLIPSARLSQSDLREIEVNPDQFYAFNFHYSTTSVRTSRTVCAQIISALCRYETVMDCLYDNLLSHTVDPFDFEGRVFLLTKFVLETNSERGPMIEEDAINLLLGLLSDLNHRQPYVAVSLINFAKAVLPFFDPPQGVELAQNVILGSNSPIVICAGAKLLYASLNELEHPETSKFSDVVKKLLESTASVHSKSLSKATEIALKFGGEDVLPYVNSTVHSILSALVNGEDESVPLNSLANIIGGMPNCEGLKALASEVYPKCAEYYTKSSETVSFSEALNVLTVINEKLVEPIEAQFSSTIELISEFEKDDSLASLCPRISGLLIPLLMSSRTSSFESQNSFYLSCMDLTKIMIERAVDDVDAYSNTLLLVSSLIQILGVPGLAFVGSAIDGLVSGKDQIFGASIFVLASALMCDIDQSKASFTDEIVDFLISSVNPESLPSYQLLKAGFITLVMLSKGGVEKCYLPAVDILEPLSSMRMMEERSADEVSPASISAISYTCPTLFDEWDEFDLFLQVTKSSGRYMKLKPKQKKLVKEIFNL